MNSVPPAIATHSRSKAWAALLHTPGYSSLLAHTTTSLLATSTYSLGQGWLVLQMTNSPALVGVAAGLGGGVQFLMSPLAGVLSDRFDRRRLLLAMQLSSALFNFVLFGLVLAGHLALWHLLVSSALLGINRAVALTARGALTYDLVGPERILSAVATQFTFLHVAFVLGPLTGGFILAAWGAGPFFLAVACAASLSAGLLLFGRTPPRTQTSERRPMLTGLRDGFDIVRCDTHLRNVAALMFTTEFLGFAVTSMFPVMARDVLHGNARLLGMLTAAWSLGGFGGAVALATLGEVRRKGELLALSALIMGACLLAFSFSRLVPLSLLLLLAGGAAGVLYDIMAGTLFQLLSPNAERGRVASVQNALISGAGFGGFALGGMASLIGAPVAIAVATGVVTANAARHMTSAGKLSKRTEASRELR